MAAPFAGGHFLGGMSDTKFAGWSIMQESKPDMADQIGKHVSTILIVLLFALFVYAYLGRFIFG